MSQAAFSMFGLRWPAGTQLPMVHLTIAKRWREEPFLSAKGRMAPGDHLLEACRLLFTPQQFTISPWSREHAHAWCEENFLVIWGCASCSKSNDMGLFTLLDWIASPDETYSVLVSTTKSALALRSFESVLRYHRILKAHPKFSIPGKLARSEMSIINDADDAAFDSTGTMKCSIRGVAVQQGSTEEARANLQGAHAPYVNLILDESEAIRPAAFEVRTNLSVGCTNFRCVMMCNPDSLSGQTAQYSEPLTGWDSVDENTDRWRSRYGLVLHHNAFKSPSITEPDGKKKYPYLVTQKQIDSIIAEENGNADANRVWVMLKGFPSPQGSEKSIISEREIITFKAPEKPTWANNNSPIRIASLDPAFTSEGDGCILRMATLGREAAGHAILDIGEPVAIPILSSSERPVSYQISDFVANWLMENEISIHDLAVDDSGTQSIADVLVNEIGSGLTRYNYALRPSDKAISVANSTPAQERFKNSITELWALAAEFIRHGQLRSLDQATIRQLTQRRFRRIVATKLRGLETKGEYKKRTKQRSPDEADALAMLCGLARDKYGFIPGGAPTIVLDSYPSAGSHVAQSIVGVKRFSKNYLAPRGLGRLSSYLRSGK